MPTKTINPLAAIQRYLKPEGPACARFRQWHQLTAEDLAEFKRSNAGRSEGENERAVRRDIRKAFGKPVSRLTLAEFRDYRKPSFHAQDYLKELWPQLRAAEQELVKQLHRMAFIFPASFETEEQYLRACASRLERFFGRKFRVKRAGKKTKFVYVSPDIARG